MTLQQAYEEAVYQAQLSSDTKLITHYLRVIEKLKLKQMGRENKPKCDTN